MKKNVTIALVLGLFSATPLLSQVGINTEAPSATIDVNGNARIRTLPDQNAPDVVQLASTDSNGNLLKTSPLQAMYSSGLFVKGDSSWSNLYINSGAKLDFAGRMGDNGGGAVAFSVLYVPFAGFTVVSATGNITVNPVNSTSFTVTSAPPSSNIHTLTISYSSGSGKADIVKTGPNSFMFGSFSSLPFNVQ